MLRTIVLVMAGFLALAGTALADPYPTPVDGTYVVPTFHFADGETLANLRLHYVTVGTPRPAA